IGRKVYTAEDQIKDLIRRGRRDAGAVVKDAEVDGRLQSGTSVARSGMRSLIEHDVDSDGLGQAYSLAERAGEGVPETDLGEDDMGQHPSGERLGKPMRR